MLLKIRLKFPHGVNIFFEMLIGKGVGLLPVTPKGE